MIDGRTQQLMNLISELKRENQKLRKLLKENQINITYEKQLRNMILIRVPALCQLK